jgi:hypothetical protein
VYDKERGNGESGRKMRLHACVRERERVERERFSPGEDGCV